MSTHTQTARRFAAVAALLVSIVGCDSNKSPNLTDPSPSGDSRPPPSGLGIINGRVLDATAGHRPVSNLGLRVFGADEYSAVRAVELPNVVTDRNGWYQLTDVKNLVLYFTTAPGSDHRFLCDRYPLDTTQIGLDGSSRSITDLVVVPSSWASATVPSSALRGGTSVYGRVTERVDGTLRPVAEATVTLGSESDPPATTDAAGFYMICSLEGTDQINTVTARKTGYRPTVREYFGGSDYVVDLELARE